jgi:hypothetical protein
LLIGRRQFEGIAVRAPNVGSNGGLAATKRGECDIAANPSDGPGHRQVQSPVRDPDAGARLRLWPLTRASSAAKATRVSWSGLSRTQLAVQSPGQIA